MGDNLPLLILLQEKRKKKDPLLTQTKWKNSDFSWVFWCWELPSEVFAVLGSTVEVGGLKLHNPPSSDVIGGTAPKLSLPDRGSKLGFWKKTTLHFGAGKQLSSHHLLLSLGNIWGGFWAPAKRGTAASMPSKHILASLSPHEPRLASADTEWWLCPVWGPNCLGLGSSFRGSGLECPLWNFGPEGYIAKNPSVRTPWNKLSQEELESCHVQCWVRSDAPSPNLPWQFWSLVLM